MSPSPEGLVQSLQARLLNHARFVGADPNTVLARYRLERFIHRLSRSAHTDRFVLKGGMLLRVWLGETSRPMRDADLLGYGDRSSAEFRRIFMRPAASRSSSARRRTLGGPDLPAALTSAFGADRDKPAQWRAFLRKSHLAKVPQSLLTATHTIAESARPILEDRPGRRTSRETLAFGRRLGALATAREDCPPAFEPNEIEAVSSRQVLTFNLRGRKLHVEAHCRREGGKDGSRNE